MLLASLAVHHCKYVVAAIVAAIAAAATVMCQGELQTAQSTCSRFVRMPSRVAAYLCYHMQAHPVHAA